MASGYHTAKACVSTGKRQFGSKREAFAAFQTGGGKAYRCKSCGSWHISRGYR